MDENNGFNPEEKNENSLGNEADAAFENTQAMEEQVQESRAEETSYQTEAGKNGFEQDVAEELPLKTKKTGSSVWPKVIVGTILGSLVGGTAIGGSYALVSTKMEQQYNTHNMVVQQTVTGNGTEGTIAPVSTNNSISDIANNVGPSVVSIYNTKIVSTFLGNYDQSGLGSGVIFKEDNEKVYMVTNCHVVEGATSLAVNFLGNTKVEGELVGQDPTTDLAVVAVRKENMDSETLKGIRIAKLGDSDKVQVGQLAVAIGTPMEAAFNNTVTAGVISAINREVQVDASRSMKLLQTDAAINPGNSGGALVGPSGEVIGINTIKLVDSSVEGMGFAIPINDVKPVIEEILQTGSIKRPTLGIMGTDVTSATSQVYELPIGIYVAEVTPGGSADLAGIKAGDVIFEFDGTQVKDMNQLKGLIAKKRVGDKVEVKLVRDKQKKVLTVTLKEGQAAVTTTQPTSLY